MSEFFRYNPQSRIFAGDVEADEQPENTTTVSPHPITPKTFAVWAEDRWVEVALPDGSIDFIPAVPTLVSMRQARLALLQAGLLQQVESSLSSITDETQRLAAQIEWEYATEVKRDSPLVQAISSSMGLTAQQLDALFIQAATL